MEAFLFFAPFFIIFIIYVITFIMKQYKGLSPDKRAKVRALIRINLKSLYSFAVLILIITNLIPVFGFIFFHWDITDLLQLYWIESIITGFYFLLKLNKSITYHEKKIPPLKSKRTFSLIFFGLGYFIPVVIYFLIIRYAFSGTFDFINSYFILVFLIPVFLSHGFSYKYNYIAKEEYKKETSGLLLILVQRIFVLHGTILFTGIIGNSWIVLIILKIIVDIILHIILHRNKEASSIRDGIND